VNYRNLVNNFSSSPKKHILNQLDWWDQQQWVPVHYTTNRFGKNNSLLNIQYAGPLLKLTSTLEKNGWKKRSNSYFYSLIIRAAGKKNINNTPLIAQLYHNKKPDFIMTYHVKGESSLLVLQLWYSNYHLTHNEQPVLIGSLASNASNKRHLSQPIANFRHIKKSLPNFQFKQIAIDKRGPQKLRNQSISFILLIKNSPQE
jgi:hypothetical protein